MQARDFFYELPEELIAQKPLKDRSASRLLCLDGNTGRIRDRLFLDLAKELNHGDLLILNNTRVIPARLYGVKPSGGRIEVLIERVLDDRHVSAQVRASKPPKPGGRLELEGAVDAEILARIGGFYKLRFLDPRPVMEILTAHGHVPLPPYIRRSDERNDRSSYQTVYAEHPGAVAAPTAGLHFDANLLQTLSEREVEIDFVTLHVGAGTFQPVRVDDISEHRMHPEYVNVPASVCAAVTRCRQRDGRVVAVGTTTVRSLETAARDGDLKAFEGDTELFITPGFEFRVIDVLITNFHLPESTLLMLVCAFGGYEQVMRAYQHALERRYRFYSYGDAMLVERQPQASS
jgi:S-adenosylmethionine:tRNA ribosyltransferase-isomerase